MSDEAATSDAEPIPCSACRGTGQVISGLGGAPSQLPCPWCEGSGIRIPEHDAQAASRAAAAERPAPAGSAPAPDAA